MAYNPLNPNGQATMANSQPVVIASNQTPVSVAGTVNIGTQSGSVVAFQSPGSILAVSAIAAPNQSVSGQVGASIIGTVPVTQSGAVISSISGTVVVASIVGTYAEDTGHTTGDAGLFTLNVRNDTLSSITSSDLDYSPNAVGPSGENIAVNAPFNKWIQGKASCFTGVIQPIIAAQGSSIFTYITAVQAANNSANNAYLTFYGATDSVIGYSAVPANGGSNIIIPNAWKSNANGAFSASVSGVASVFLSASGFISKS